jgi:hypothetical protein
LTRIRGTAIVATVAKLKTIAHTTAKPTQPSSGGSSRKATRSVSASKTTPVEA